VPSLSLLHHTLNCFPPSHCFLLSPLLSAQKLRLAVQRRRSPCVPYLGQVIAEFRFQCSKALETFNVAGLSHAEAGGQVVLADVVAHCSDADIAHVESGNITRHEFLPAQQCSYVRYTGVHCGVHSTGGGGGLFKISRIGFVYNEVSLGHMMLLRCCLILCFSCALCSAYRRNLQHPSIFQKISLPLWLFNQRRLNPYKTRAMVMPHEALEVQKIV
jgi:hypothetical protein